MPNTSDSSKAIPKFDENHFIRPRLRLFLSVDIIGSTAFKQSHGDGDPFKGLEQEWLGPFSKFYRNFDQNLAIEWEKFKKFKSILGNPLWLWKILGDELIYVKEISEQEEIICCIQIWRKVVHEYRSILHSQGLDLKTTAWIAGFPYINAELAFLRDIEKTGEDPLGGEPVLQNLRLLKIYYDKNLSEITQGEFLLDFIGPSMDTGFRLAAYSTSRKMTLSVDLAYLLSKQVCWWKKELRAENITGSYLKINFRFLGRNVLEGVIKSIPYPIFWIDNTPKEGDEVFFNRYDELDALEDKIRKEENPIPPDDVTKFSEAFIKSIKGPYPCMPYIYNSKTSTDETEHTIPPEHAKIVAYLQERYAAEIEKLDLVEKDLVGKDNKKLDQKAVDRAVKDLAKVIDNLSKIAKKTTKKDK